MFLRASDVKAAKEAIERQGFVLLKGALTPQQLQDAQKATFSASGAVRLPIVIIRLFGMVGRPNYWMKQNLKVMFVSIGCRRSIEDERSGSEYLLHQAYIWCEALRLLLLM